MYEVGEVSAGGGWDGAVGEWWEWWKGGCEYEFRKEAEIFGAGAEISGSRSGRSSCDCSLLAGTIVCRELCG